ncbi:MAG: SsrA-binding protein SmpB [Candidatus Omnitrophota bacterium]|nr:SsrA-binding protein SmpB [Candidatus Omnitrophota bacterium]
MESKTKSVLNREAFRDYAVLETFECGIELKGSEVKSVRAGEVSLKDSFARVDDGEVLVYNVHINPYFQASYQNVEPTRIRKLLLHKNQIIRIWGETSQKKLTLIPLKLYFNHRGKVKMELALAKGKRFFDKRADLKQREVALEVKRIMRRKR